MTHPVRNHVLIVDDEPRMRDMLVRATTELGFTATAVRSAETAAKAVSEQRPSVVLLDLNLPGMGGLELAEKLHADDPVLPIIILTGYGSLDAARQAIRLDVTDFLTKPCSLAELERALSRAQRRSLAAPPTASFPTETAAVPVEARATLEEVERQHILQTLERNDNNRAAAAAELGISERTLYYRIANYQRTNNGPPEK